MRSIIHRRFAHLAPLLICALGLAVLLAARRLDEQVLEIRESSLGPPFHTPLVSIEHRDGRAGDSAALIVHGFQCNKSMMVQIAKFLAFNGIDAYLIDLPGHGASADAYTGEKALQATAQALWHLVSAKHIPKDRIAMVGHSYGAMILSYLGIRDRDLHSHVLIGPGYIEGFTVDAPENVLILLAERDHEYVQEFSYHLLNDATGGELTAHSEFFGSHERGDARLLEIVPGAAHVSLMWNAYVFDETRQWIANTLGKSSTLSSERNATRASNRSLLIAALAIVVATLVVFEITRLLPAATSGSESRLPKRGFLALPLALAAGVGATRLLAPLEALQLHEGDIVASAFLNTGVAMLVLTGISVGRVRLPPTRDLLVAILLALTAAAIVYAAVNVTVTPQFYHATFSGLTRRALICLVLFAAFLPFFCISEAFFRAIQARFRSGYVGGSVSLAASLVFFSAFLISIGFIDGMLRRFAIPLFGAVMYAQLVAAVFYHKLRSSVAGGVFSSLLMAWLICLMLVEQVIAYLTSYHPPKGAAR
jgi:pimeloyl-ACP methyl ester carboxylesterase